MTEPNKEACNCGGKIIVHHSQTCKLHRRQYLRCNKCGAKHGARNVPHELEAKMAELEARIERLESAK